MTLAKEDDFSNSSFSTSDTKLQVDTPFITGTYAGTVAITEPVQLGVLDLAFNLANNGNTFSGAIDPARTLVFNGGPTLAGSITGSVNGITPTFTINSAVFTGTVSGRQVQRQVTLTGEVWENGDVLQGIYAEVVHGFTPRPLTTRGIFLVTRAAQTVNSAPQSTLLVQVDPASVPPNGSATVSVTLLDGSLQPIPNAQVSFSSNEGVFSPAVAQTNSNGMASTIFRAGATPGLGTITASSNGAISSRAILVTNSSLTLQAGAEQLIFGGKTILTATLRDLSNNPVGGQVISFTATLGTVFPLTSTTNTSGQAVTTFTAGNTVGEAKVTAETDMTVTSKIIYIASQLDPNLKTYLPLILKAGANQ